MCKEKPHFDKSRNVRIDMPPCCREKVMAVTRLVVADLNRLRIPYMFFGGAVLGWMRNRKFVPYDQDVDIWMDGRLWDTPMFNQLRRNWTEKFGLYTEYRDERFKLWTFYSGKNQQGLDIWPWYVDRPLKVINGTALYSSSQRMVNLGEIFDRKWAIPYKVIFPRKPVNFEGMDTFVPHKPAAYNLHTYGRNWRKEMRCTMTNEDRKCSE